MTVIFSPSARKQLNKLPLKQGLKVTRKLSVLENNSFSGKVLTGDLKGFFSLRAWPYRIVYRIYKDRKIILITAVEHRQGVYK